jgi:hypothetical protein
MAQLVAAALDGLGPLLRSGVPFSFFGHSMGSWVAYAAIQELQARGWDVPVKLYVSATRAPQLAGPQHDTDGIQMHRLEANEFWHVFERRYGHNPDLVSSSIWNRILSAGTRAFVLAIYCWAPCIDGAVFFSRLLPFVSRPLVAICDYQRSSFAQIYVRVLLCRMTFMFESLYCQFFVRTFKS